MKGCKMSPKKKVPFSVGQVDTMAICAHETNRAYCASIGDKSQVPWDRAPANIRQSAIDGVVHILNNPSGTPEDSHNNWLKFKEQDGWVYGEVKDLEKKTHPCCVPYSELPQEQRVKDIIFRSVVMGMAVPYVEKFMADHEMLVDVDAASLL
jgi:hypothetical protein